MQPARWFGDRPIKQKLVAILMFTSGVVLLLTSAGFAAYEVSTFRQVTVKNLSTVGAVIAANSTAPLAFENPQDATEVLSALAAETHIVAAGLYATSGSLFATYPPRLPAESLPAAPGHDGAQFTAQRLILVQPVVQDDKRLGTLYIESDLSAISGRLRSYAGIALLMVAVSALVAWLIATRIQRTISGPVLSLAETARAVSDRQDYSVRAHSGGKDEVGLLTDAFNQMLARIQEQTHALNRSNQELERRVTDRTRELENQNIRLTAANGELDAFAYSVSHDLRAPLRSIDGFSQILLEDYAAQLDEGGRDALQRVRTATQRMGTLIDDLLRLARITRTEMRPEKVDLTAMARDLAGQLREAEPARKIDIAIEPNLTCNGDAHLLRVVLDNLLRNSWKYSAKQTDGKIEFASTSQNGERVFFIRDNGAGFDMKYADKLFGVFQRLHSPSEFEGTGVGLATVRRVITRHGGRIWAKGAVNEGATFYFTVSNGHAEVT
jgi:signal transduction histidine kinase